MSLERRTPMPRGKELKRGTGMPPRNPENRLKRGTGLSRAPRKPKAARGTGPSRTVRVLVMTRDGYCCVGCGKNVVGIDFSLQHRVARGMGGTSRPEANSPVVLVLLCGSATSPGSCHLACEQRDPSMHERGLWLNSWEDPALVPVVIATPGGPARLWLLPDGGRSTMPPEGIAA